MSDETISAAWGKILGVPIESIGAYIGLVPQLDRVVQSEGRERLAAVVAQYRQEWLTSTFPLAQPFNHAVESILPSDQSYLALGSLADALAIAAPDGPTPDEATRTELSELLRAATEEAHGRRRAAR